MWICEHCGTISAKEVARPPTIEEGLDKVHMDCGGRVYWERRGWW